MKALTGAACDECQQYGTQRERKRTERPRRNRSEYEFDSRPVEAPQNSDCHDQRNGDSLRSGHRFNPCGFAPLLPGWEF